MKITLCDIDSRMFGEWNKVFYNIKDVEIRCQGIFDDENDKFDAIVSPANSFGYMDGGIDLVYSKHFGWKLQEDLQHAISKLPMKELLIGQTLAIETGNSNIPWLLSSPTMRVGLNVSDTANAYLAFKSSLLKAKELQFDSIICPGLATSVGGMKHSICAKQMRQAYDEIILGKSSVFHEFYDAYVQHMSMVDIDRRKKYGAIIS